MELLFPDLPKGKYEQHSPYDREYNCIAYAAGDYFRWWSPGGFWPIVSGGFAFDDLIAAYESVGFETCATSFDVEAGTEKVALYRADDGTWSHAARQRHDGWWESKLGMLPDIIHQHPRQLAGKAYGNIGCCMKRPWATSLRVRLEFWRRARLGL